MFVGERMSHPVITIQPTTPIMEALKRMRTERIRRLPVIGEQGKLVGLVSERDLLHAAPSDATTLSVWEMNYLISKIQVAQVMTKAVKTVSPETPLEEAARMMADNKIGGLPVVRDGEVVGIITETDLFKVFLELLGAREDGVRMALLVPDVPGELAKITQAIFETGGNIVALGTFLGESTENREVVLKVQGAGVEPLKEALQPVVERIMDVRET